MHISITIPADTPFSALRLARDQDGAVSLDTAVILRICEASGIHPDMLLGTHEDAIAGLIVTWYRAHREAGGEPDTIAEELITEVEIEDAHGQRTSHQPGRA